MKHVSKELYYCKNCGTVLAKNKQPVECPHCQYKDFGLLVFFERDHLSMEVTGYE
jgi:rubrerythrin